MHIPIPVGVVYNSNTNSFEDTLSGRSISVGNHFFAGFLREAIKYRNDIFTKPIPSNDNIIEGEIIEDEEEEEEDKVVTLYPTVSHDIEIENNSENYSENYYSSCMSLVSIGDC